MRRTMVFIVAAAFVVVSCARNPMDIPLSAKNYESIVTQVRKTADKQTWDAVNGLVILGSMSSGDIHKIPAAWIGKSFDQIIAEAKAAVAKQTSANTTANTESQPGLVLLSAKPMLENGIHYIEGSAENVSKTTYGYVEVSIQLKDKDGNVTGETMANINNLAAGAVWKWKAPIIEGYDPGGTFSAEITGY